MTMRKALSALALLAVIATPVRADRAADDLQAVKKAVAASSQTQAAAPAQDAQTPGATPAPRSVEPRWFRVRVVEKSGSRARVKINLPLALVRSLGDDLPLGCDHWWKGEHHACPRLGDVLRALDSGQSLVEIDDEEATVRVWIE
jgi:hypothetical protein